MADFIGKNKECSAFIYGIMSLVDKVSNGKEFSIIHKADFSINSLKTLMIY